jgi:hypothetical protein
MLQGQFGGLHPIDRKSPVTYQSYRAFSVFFIDPASLPIGSQNGPQ